MGLFEAVIPIADLYAGYDNREILHGVTFQIYLGAITVIVGPGGSGKSTLLKVFTKFNPVDEPQFWYRCNVHFPFSTTVCLNQKNQRNCSLQNLLAGSTLGHTPEEIIRQCWKAYPHIAGKLIHSAHLELNSIPNELARLAEITVRLATPAHFYFFDEPDAEVASENQTSLSQVMKQQLRYKTVVIVTHNLQFARSIADFCVLLIDGEVVESGPVDQFFDNPTHPRTRHYVRMGC